MRNRFFGGCVKSAPGVATGLFFRINCAPHKKEMESTRISLYGLNGWPVTYSGWQLKVFPATIFLEL